MKIKNFIPVFALTVAFMVFLCIPSYAQEDVITDEPVVEDTSALEIEAVEEAVKEEVVKEEPSLFKPGWTAKVYVNGGPIEPWGDPGTGAMFAMGYKGQLGAQLNIGNWIKLPVIFKPLTAEVMVGYTMFNIKDGHVNDVYTDSKTTIISGVVLGRYDITDLIMKLIGVEYPSFGIFGVAGFQYNMQSWDFPNGGTYDPVSAFGLNLGVGVKYNMQNLVGKPVELDVRFTQGVFVMGDVKEKTTGVLLQDPYNHTENGILIGVAYPF